jgi:C4-dicarboxylate transporter DctM subunit
MTKISALLDGVLIASGWAAVILIMGSGFCVFYETILRTFINRPTVWVSEISVYLVAGGIYLAIAFGLRKGHHVSVTLLTDHASYRTRQNLNMIVLPCSLAVSTILVWGAYRIFFRAVTAGQESASIIRVPEWIPLAPFVLGISLLLLQVLRMTVTEVNSIIRRREDVASEVKGESLVNKQSWIDKPYVLLPLIFSLLGVGLFMLTLEGGPRIVGVIILLLIFLVLGAPVFLVLSLVGGLALYSTFNFELVSQLALATIAYDKLQSFVLLCIPLFIVSGTILNAAGFTELLFDLARDWLPGVRGKLGIVCIAACTLFAACSGSSSAAAAAFGLIAVPPMLARNYERTLTYGCVAAGGTLAVMIPPSIGPVVYGELTGVSVGELFIAGIMPGILIALFFALYVSFKCFRDRRYDPDLADRGSPWIVKARTLRAGISVLGFPVIVLGGIYSGMATPTEISAICVIYSLVVYFWKRGLNFKPLLGSLLHGVLLATMVLSIFWGAMILGNAFTVMHIGTLFKSFIMSLSIAPEVVVILTLCSVLLLGMIMDATSMTSVCIPIYAPLIQHLGFSLVWYHVLWCLVMEIGMLTPPVGMNLFILMGTANAKLDEVARGSLPFVFCLLAAGVLIFIFPEIALWLVVPMRG